MPEISKIDDKLKKLIELNMIICGRKYSDEGFTMFERLSPEEFEKIPAEERAYATASMGRAIFAIDENGKTHNIKGVDSNINLDELGPMELLNAEAILYSQGKDKYTLAAVIFNKENPEIRIKGTSIFSNIQEEGIVASAISQIGVKTQFIQTIREFSQEYRIKHGLPLYVDGSETTKEKEMTETLKTLYGDRYSSESEEGIRPESMKEYLERIGFFTSPEIIKKIESLGYSIEEFISSVDEVYKGGQRYGQVERVMGSPFRISDIEICLKHKDYEGLKALFDFSETINENFTIDLAGDYGKNIATLMNNGWTYVALFNRQDFCLTGEFCDDEFVDIKQFQGDKPSDVLRLSDAMNKYKGQIMHGASCVKVIQDSMRLLGKDEKSIQSVLDTFLNSFANNINYELIGNFLGRDAKQMEEEIIEQFGQKRNWTEEMSTICKDGITSRDNAIYNANIGYEEFYEQIAETLCEKFKTKKAEKGLQNIAESDEAMKNLSTVFEGLREAIHVQEKEQPENSESERID